MHYPHCCWSGCLRLAAHNRFPTRPVRRSDSRAPPRHKRRSPIQADLVERPQARQLTMQPRKARSGLAVRSQIKSTGKPVISPQGLHPLGVRGRDPGVSSTAGNGSQEQGWVCSASGRRLLWPHEDAWHSGYRAGPSFQSESPDGQARPLNRVSPSSVRWVVTKARHELSGSTPISSITPTLPVDGFAQARGFTPTAPRLTVSAMTA